jgi:hypothetical protein
MGKLRNKTTANQIPRQNNRRDGGCGWGGGGGWSPQVFDHKNPPISSPVGIRKILWVLLNKQAFITSRFTLFLKPTNNFFLNYFFKQAIVFHHFLVKLKQLRLRKKLSLINIKKKNKDTPSLPHLLFKVNSSYKC